jgi:hypothetical protein
MVRIRDISADGAIIEGAPPLEAGIEVVFDSEKSGEVTARVDWQAAGRTGIAFSMPIASPLDAAGLRSFMGAAPVRGEDWR